MSCFAFFSSLKNCPLHPPQFYFVRFSFRFFGLCPDFSIFAFILILSFSCLISCFFGVFRCIFSYVTLHSPTSGLRSSFMSAPAQVFSRAFIIVLPILFLMMIHSPLSLDDCNVYEHLGGSL